MNIHEHQAKQILKKFGAVVPEGVFALNVNELIEKVKTLKTEKYVLKAQIHAGGRGKAGGVKILNTIEELTIAANELLGKTLVTHQTGPEGREVKRLYVEESSNIDKEFYLSCLVDRASSKIAFISSDQGGMDIEEVASSSPEKIVTTKVNMGDEISDTDCKKIIQIFNLNDADKPIEIFADEGIEWHKNKQKYVAVGNAKALSGSLSLESDKIEAFYNEKESSNMNIKEVKALKNVIVKDNKMKITGGDYAEYNISKDYFLITGKNIILTSESNVLRSKEKLEYWRQKNIAIATGKAEAKKDNEFIVSAEKLVWYLKETDKKTKVKKLLGFKNVSIKTNNEVAFSDKAIYNNETEICKLYGNVKLQRGESFLLGEYAEVDLKRGISKLLPAPGNSLNENKVRALIDKGGIETDESN